MCSLQQIAGITPGGHNYRGCSNPLDTQIGLYPQDAIIFGLLLPRCNYLIVTPQDTINITLHLE